MIFHYRDLNKLEEGISEKCLHVVHSLSAFVGCIVLALLKGWELALISLSSLPVISITIGVIGFISSRLSKNELEAYAKAGSIAEEVLSSIRTVVAFDGSNKESLRYIKIFSFKIIIYLKKKKTKKKIYFLICFINTGTKNIF